jgi:hypothetical protein
LIEARHRATSPKRRLKPAAFLAPAVIVVLGLVAFLVFRGGDGAGGGIFGGGPDDTIPTLEFKIAKAAAVPTTQTAAKELSGAADQVATEVAQTMTDLYTAAFLDPGNWRENSYDDVWAMFEGGAQPTAEQSVATLTLGSTAGDVYEQMARPKGKVRVKVLTDADDRPTTAVAIVTFTAHATGKDGTLTLIVSKGQYFLQHGSDGWTIYSFSVGRDDEERVPTPGPSGGTPSAVAS